MLRRFKLPSALIMSLLCFTPLVQAGEQLLDGVRPFICDGEATVLLQTDNVWAITGEPDIEVSEIHNGWQIGGQGMGFIGYLKEQKQDEWTLEILSDVGYKKVSCIDLTESVSEVVTTIKPRLDEAILDTERALRDTKFKLDNELTKNSQLSAKHISILDTLHKTETALEATKAEYSAFRTAAVAEFRASPGALFIRDLLEMDPGERNEKVNGSNLVQALNRKGDLSNCVKRLRDKAKLSDACEELILEFFLIEGWQRTTADQMPLVEGAVLGAPISTTPLTSGEKSDMIFAVAQCWSVGSLSTEALATTVVVGVQMTEEAKPIVSSIRMLSFSGGSDRAAQQAFQAARRAIIRCGASGYGLPKEKYGQWREIELTFNPERMRIR